jgi:hypothetical protein
MVTLTVPFFYYTNGFHDSATPGRGKAGRASRSTTLGRPSCECPRCRAREGRPIPRFVSTAAKP